MSKLCTITLLFYSIGITICVPSNYDVRTFDDLVDDARFNILEMLKAFDEKKTENRRETTDPNLENWTGRWMPDRPGDPTPTPKVYPVINVASGQIHHLPMGKIEKCDDGKTNLTLDWNNSPVNYTCYGRTISPNFSISPVLYSETVPPAYVAVHKCMDETIVYDEAIPLYGTHRPAWPVYGEYKFLPPQRWLHSMEHGALVMLYHPCANPMEVKRLKTLVKNCLRRHIISPYYALDKDRPLALLTWGHQLSMSYVTPHIIRDFIREKALQGPERIPANGDFEEGLLSISQTVTDFEDSTLCPNI